MQGRPGHHASELLQREVAVLVLPTPARGGIRPTLAGRAAQAHAAQAQAASAAALAQVMALTGRTAQADLTVNAAVEPAPDSTPHTGASVGHPLLAELEVRYACPMDIPTNVRCLFAFGFSYGLPMIFLLRLCCSYGFHMAFLCLSYCDYDVPMAFLWFPMISCLRL